MAAAAPPSTQSQEQTSKWQDLLLDTCQQHGYDQPQWQIMSDRRGMNLPSGRPPQTVHASWPFQVEAYRLPLSLRPLAFVYLVESPNTITGGRTAWSSIVSVAGQRYPARFWYDGSYVNNAKEDAAEVALQKLGVTIVPGQSQSQGNGPQGGYYGAVGS